MNKIILASGSPRRRELLQLAEVKFDVCLKSVDESVPEGTEPCLAAEMTAKKKATEVAFTCSDTIVLGADTIVVLDGHIMGKPADKEDAVQMLKTLSGREHTVITGVCLAYNGHTVTFHEESKVRFFDLTDEEIRHYVSTGEPLDKAGAYGIQGKGCVLVEKIEGDYYNIVGLPVARVVREIHKLEKQFNITEKTVKLADGIY